MRPHLFSTAMALHAFQSLDSRVLQARPELFYSFFRSQPTIGMYGKTVRESGKEAADKWLEEKAQERRIYDFAKLVGPLAHALKAVVNASPDHVRLMNISQRTAAPFTCRLSRGKVLAVTNPVVPDCDCTPLEDSRLFNPSGKLGIKAFVLAYDEKHPSRTELSIVLPVHRREEYLMPYHDFDQKLLDYGFTAVTLTVDGWTDVSTLVPQMEDPTFLARSLGIAHGSYLPLVRRTCGLGGRALDIEDPVNYFAEIGPQIERYLQNLAMRLASHH